MVETAKKVLVKNILSECDNIEDLSAKKLALLADTSQSTISRIVREIGYKDFTDLKYSLALKPKYPQMNCFFMNNLEFVSDLSLDAIVEIISKENIGLIANQKFNAQALFFASFLRANNYDFTHLISAKQLPKDLDTVIYLGKIPKDNIVKEVNYIQIIFDNKSLIEYDNVSTVVLKSIDITKIDKMSFYYESTAMQNYLLMLISKLAISF